MESADGRMSSPSTSTMAIAIRDVTYRHDPRRDIKSEGNPIRAQAIEPPLGKIGSACVSGRLGGQYRPQITL
jgi:hypothetical protein